MTLVATDTVKVTHINLIIHSSFFTSYEMKKEKIELVVDLSKLLKIFRCSQKDDTFTIKYDPQDSFLRIEFLNLWENRFWHFKLFLAEIEFESFKVPEIKYTTKIQLPSEYFHNTVKNLSIISDEVNIKTQNNSIYFLVDGKFT